MTSITPKGKKIAYLHLAANTPGHPDQEEAKARLAERAGIAREPVAETKNFSLELAQQLINSDSKFPVSFDDVSRRCVIMNKMFVQVEIWQ